MSDVTSYEYEDLTPPTLIMNEDYTNFSTHDDSISISATVTDYEHLYFLGECVDEYVSPDGVFRVSMPLRDGGNPIELKAVDAAGNETTYTACVTKITNGTWNFKKVSYIGIGILILLLIFLTVKEVKSHKGRENKIDVKSFLPLIIVVPICIAYIFMFIIPHTVSESMEPTIMIGSVGLGYRLAYKTEIPKRGDIVLFKKTDLFGDEVIMKRAIGLPGDEVSFADGYVYINGVILDEPYIGTDELTFGMNVYNVPDGCVFVIGDNRSDSYDSRYWNEPYVPQEDLLGKYLFTFPYLHFANNE